MVLNFLKKGNEYNKLAKSFNGVYLSLQELKSEFENQNIEIDYEQQLAFLAFISRIEILDRMDLYKWPLTTPISIPNMSKSLITLATAYKNTILEIINFSETFDIVDSINAILDKKEDFYIIEKSIPNYLKNILNY
jgi:hypothetical protein